MRLAWLVFLGALSLACGEERAAPDPDPAPRLPIRVDGRELAQVVLDPAGEPLSLADALPPGAPGPDLWRVVTARRPDRTLALGMESYGDHAIMLYRDDDDDRPTIGVFRRSTQARERRAPVRSLAGIDGIDIETVRAPLQPADGPGLVLVRAGTTQALGPGDLGPLPEARWRTKTRKDRGPAWSLADIVELSGRLDRVEHVELVTGNGQRVAISTTDLPGRIMLRADKRAFHAKAVSADGTTLWRARDVRRIEVLENALPP